MTLIFDAARLRRIFEENTFARGESYFERGKVLYCEVEHQGRRVYGEVAGNYSRDYEVSVGFSKTGITTDCTCPMGNRCKHAVAILLAALEQDGGTDTLYQRWLERVETISHKNKPLGSAAGGDTPWQSIYLAVRLLHQDSERSTESIVIKTGYRRDLKKGGLSKIVVRSPKELMANNADGDMLPAYDKETLQLLETGSEPNSVGPRHPISGLHQKALVRLAEQQQLYWDQSLTPLSVDKPRELQWCWHDDNGNKQLELRLPHSQSWFLLPLPQPWFVDADNHQIGPIETPVPTELLHQLRSLPSLSDESLEHLTTTVLGAYSSQQLALPNQRANKELIAPLAPQLQLFRRGRDYMAAFCYGYDEVRLSPQVLQKPEMRVFDSDKGALWIQRDNAAEQQAFDLMAQFPLLVHPDSDDSVPMLLQYDGENARAFWQQWLSQWREPLSAQGWEFSLGANLNLDPIEVNTAALEFSGKGNTFELGLTAELDEGKVAIMPLLLDWLEDNPDWRESRQHLLLERTNGAPLQLDYQVLLPVISVLAELTDRKPREKVKLNQTIAALLPEPTAQLQWRGGKALQRLRLQLRELSEIEAVEPPTHFEATLRDYQQQGLDWLSFLHQFGFGGVLADDMGLGKTIQTLAHLQRLKEHGQLSRPALLICPTSLVGNWRRESAQFAPDLDLLVVHGSRRQEDFDRIEKADLVITTYPLIHRDIDTMVMHDFSLLILDEAQAIKNPSAKATLAVKDLSAEQRIALTGTPMENHLGELWSLYDFVMPGLLGKQTWFANHFRKPIEQHGDEAVHQWLLSKISPFMLRRTKDQVVTELPPKTEIVKRIEMESGQRALYESVRAAMESKVRKLVEEQGIGRSRLEFLDALLKLRQICCDPQLVDLAEAKEVEETAKLDYLMERLPQMIKSGRKVLLFSQFTSMLSRIEQRLHEANIDYALLTGQTKDRQGAVDQFQSGEVPLFLISLKAGGVGLNLTQADTVIHFDPWWNPAAEQQATDRAYRIGQDKPVFVYKLICERSVEERVLELQQSKQELADSVYGEGVELGTIDDGEQLLALLRDDREARE